MRKLLLLLLLLCTALVACAPDRVRTVEAYEEWGRGRQIGRVYARTQLGLAVTPDGSQVSILYGSRENTDLADRLHLINLNDQGEITFDAELPIEITEPRSMQLLANSAGELSLFWFEGFREERLLRYATVQPDGTIGNDDLTVRSPDGIYWYKAAWTTENALQLLYVTVDGQFNSVFIEDNNLSAPILLTEGVLSADYQIGDDGRLYLAWTEQSNAQQRQFFFSSQSASGPVDSRTSVALFAAGDDEARTLVGGPSMLFSMMRLIVMLSVYKVRLLLANKMHSIKVSRWQRSPVLHRIMPRMLMMTNVA